MNINGFSWKESKYAESINTLALSAVHIYNPNEEFVWDVGGKFQDVRIERLEWQGLGATSLLLGAAGIFKASK